MKFNVQSLWIALVVSLGGFLFGFDAGIISGVMEYATSKSFFAQNLTKLDIS